MNSKSMAGWIGFAGILILIVGMLDFFQGLIALFRDNYYVVSASGFIVVDLTKWGWIMLIWGVLLVLAGIGTPRRAGMGTLVHDRARVPELHRPARVPRQQPVPALVTDHTGAERGRPLRADRALERERARAQRHPLTGSSHWRPSREIVRDGLPLTAVDSRIER